MHNAYIWNGFLFIGLYIYFWKIKALLMLAPSAVTTKNQYFPANAERMSIHCLGSGCIGKYIPPALEIFPQAGILHPSALRLSPRAISWALGCVFSNTSFLSAVYGFIVSALSLFQHCKYSSHCRDVFLILPAVHSVKTVHPHYKINISLPVMR